MSESIMSLLFGKKKAVRRKSGSKSKVVKPKGLTAAVRKDARKYKVKTRLMRNGKHVGYRKISDIKKDIRRKKKAALKRKTAATKNTKKVTRRRKSSAFGVGGSYMPLSSFMSPYPYAVDSNPPWI